MSLPARKIARFLWRVGRNALCAVPGGAKHLFPPATLAEQFGRGDAEYALRTYQHHANQLAMAGFRGASTLLEIGPGRNLGSALLWWCRALSEGSTDPFVALWDVHANAHPDDATFWPTLAHALMQQIDGCGAISAAITPAQRNVLADVAAGMQPHIAYIVCPMDRLALHTGARRFDLVVSHAALEHVRDIRAFWPMAIHLTAPTGWHSHRIDLADHGRREGNYLEMLEWSPWAWWATMRFVPGAINRWRACEYLDAVQKLGLRVLSAKRELRAQLPIPRNQLATRYRHLGDDELKTTAIDIVARCEMPSCAS